MMNGKGSHIKNNVTAGLKKFFLMSMSFRSAKEYKKN